MSYWVWVKQTTYVEWAPTGSVDRGGGGGASRSGGSEGDELEVGYDDIRQ